MNRVLLRVLSASDYLGDMTLVAESFLIYLAL